jgi:2-phospho-L-lactate guanylyltransferase
MKALLIPIKEPSSAKTRLSTLLSAAERRELVWAMFCDVIAAVRNIQPAGAVFVVTSYERAASRARDEGFEVLLEESQSSESASVDWASNVLAERGYDSVLRLPADIPLVRATDIDALLDVEQVRPGVVIVPSREGTGTNAIRRTPPALFPSHFGPNSLAKHRSEAGRCSARLVLIENDRIALDIDEPSDVETFMELGSGTQAFDLLSKWKILQRLAALPKGG